MLPPQLRALTGPGDRWNLEQIQQKGKRGSKQNFPNQFRVEKLHGPGRRPGPVPRSNSCPETVRNGQCSKRLQNVTVCDHVKALDSLGKARHALGDLGGYRRELEISETGTL
jgi:hypothetical protein